MAYPQIKNLRLIRDFKQEYVAEFLGMSQPEYSRLETGARSPRAAEIQQLAALYGVRSDQIMQQEISTELHSGMTRPFRRSDAIPRDIVDKLIDNNGELLRTVLEQQQKSERLIEKLMSFIESKPLPDRPYKEFSSFSPVNEDSNSTQKM
jgi:transcriptional regulator with XRE-family HTH domain